MTISLQLDDEQSQRLLDVARALNVDPSELAKAAINDLVSRPSDDFEMNHPFVDGNKRIGHAAMETFLVLNGLELSADVDDAERVILGLAAGKLTRDELVEWISSHVQRLQNHF